MALIKFPTNSLLLKKNKNLHNKPCLCLGGAHTGGFPTLTFMLTSSFMVLNPKNQFLLKYFKLENKPGWGCLKNVWYF